MIYSKYRISLDVRSIGSQVVLMSKRLETGREIHITLTEGLKTYTITDDCYAVFAAIKPDGNFLFNFCDIKDNTIIYTYTPQTTIVAGKMECEIRLYSATGEMLTSAFFGILISETIVDEGEVIESAFESTTITKLVEEKVTAYMVEHPIATDTTLADPEAAANAKATGDAISALSQQTGEAISALSQQTGEAISALSQQTAKTLENMQAETTEALEDKVDKEENKGLSTNDFTNKYKEKLEGIEAGANKYVLEDNAVTAEKIAQGAVSSLFYVTFPAAGWTSDDSGMFVNTVAVEGVLATDAPIVDIFVGDADSATVEALMEIWGQVAKIDVLSGSVAAYFLEAPTIDIPVKMVVIRK